MGRLTVQQMLLSGKIVIEDRREINFFACLISMGWTWWAVQYYFASRVVLDLKKF